jgi:hypothetical protein
MSSQNNIDTPLSVREWSEKNGIPIWCVRAAIKRGDIKVDASTRPMRVISGYITIIEEQSMRALEAAGQINWLDNP